MRSSHKSSHALKKPSASELKKTAKLLRTLMTIEGLTLAHHQQILQIIADHIQWPEVINTRSKNVLKVSYDPPLIYAVKCHMLDILDLLLSSPVLDINLTGRNDSNVLHYAAGYSAKRGDFLMAMTLLARPDLNLNAYNKFNTNAIIVAGEWQPTIVNAMLDCKDVELNRIAYRKSGGPKSGVYNSVLTALIEYERRYISEFKREGSKILLHAYLETIDNIIAKLLQKPGVQIDILHKRLIVGGAKRFAENLTALMYAAYHGLDRVVNLLLEAGASVDLVDNSGRNALAIATDAHHQATVAVMTAFTNRRQSGLFRPVAMLAPAASAPPAELSRPPVPPRQMPKPVALPRLAPLSQPAAHYLFKPAYDETHRQATAPVFHLVASKK